MIRRLACKSCDTGHDVAALETICSSCGRSLNAEYELEPLRVAFEDGSIHRRSRSMWRYEEVLPVGPDGQVFSLGEGWTPLLESGRLARHFGLNHLFVKDEGGNPTGSFKARGMSAAVTAAVARGARVLCAPSAGNAAGALAAYAARAGVEARVYLPDDAPLPNRMETRLLGACARTVTGTIATAAAAMNEERSQAADPASWFDLSTLKEPFRVDGKKTMGYELFEQFDRTLPDVILYPTGGGTGLLGMMKAFDELREMGLYEGAGPRMVAVQASGAASLVTAFHAGAAESEVVADAHTLASGLRVPKAFADWWLLDDLRRSNGTAIAVDDAAMLEGMRVCARLEGILLCPEAGALVAALETLRDRGDVSPDDRVVLFNTATGYKYPEILELCLEEAGRE